MKTPLILVLRAYNKKKNECGDRGRCFNYRIVIRTKRYARSTEKYTGSELKALINFRKLELAMNTHPLFKTWQKVAFYYANNIR